MKMAWKMLRLELHLVVDRDKLTKDGYTVAQLYSDLAKKLSESADAPSMTLDGGKMNVSVVDKTNSVTADNLLDTEIEITNQQTGDATTHKLREFATVEQGVASPTVIHVNSTRAYHGDGRCRRWLQQCFACARSAGQAQGLSAARRLHHQTSGELENISTMLSQMMLLLILGFVLIYLVMVAQFQSLLSPFIVILTVPLALYRRFVRLGGGWRTAEHAFAAGLRGAYGYSGE